MIDQSHNLKNKIEEMIQTAVTAQELYAKAALVDHEKLVRHQAKCELIDAEECLQAGLCDRRAPRSARMAADQGPGGGPAPGVP